MDRQKSKISLIPSPFLSKAVEVSEYYFCQNWSMKLKYPNLRISEPPLNKFYLAFFICQTQITCDISLRDQISCKVELTNQEPAINISFHKKNLRSSDENWRNTIHPGKVKINTCSSIGTFCQEINIPLLTITNVLELQIW